MPNWNKNNLRIIADERTYQNILKMVKDEKGEFTFSKLCPMPKELEDTIAPTQEQTNHTKYLKKKYGADNWYDWAYKNWGVKWEPIEADFDMVSQNGIEYITFKTPWNPPFEFYEKLSKEFPTAKLKVQYADEFFGQSPLGEAEFLNGKVKITKEPKEESKKAEKFADDVWSDIWVEN